MGFCYWDWTKRFDACFEEERLEPSEKNILLGEIPSVYLRSGRGAVW